jgi:hypothetical protein
MPPSSRLATPRHASPRRSYPLGVPPRKPQPVPDHYDTGRNYDRGKGRSAPLRHKPMFSERSCRAPCVRRSEASGPTTVCDHPSILCPPTSLCTVRSVVCSSDSRALLAALGTGWLQPWFHEIEESYVRGSAAAHRMYYLWLITADVDGVDGWSTSAHPS